MTDEQILNMIQTDDANVFLNFLQENEYTKENLIYWFCFACQVGSLKIVTKLHESGIVPDISYIESMGRTPFACAIIKNQQDVMSYLIEKRVDLTVKVQINGLSYSYLSLALLANNLELANYLIDKTGLTLEEFDLITAVEFAPLDFIQKIIDSGVSVNAINRYPIKGDPYSALYETCIINRLDAANLLLENGADPNLGIEGKPPIMLAILQNNLPFVELLMKYGANVKDKYSFERISHA